MRRKKAEAAVLRLTSPRDGVVTLWAKIERADKHPAGCWLKIGDYDRATGQAKTEVAR